MLTKLTGRGFQRSFAPVLGRALIIIALAGVASGLGGVSPAPAADDEIVLHAKPRPAPATVFTDADEKEMTLKDFAGKVLVVNFWATWCAPCVKEMPTLDALQKKLGGPNFQVLAISQDRQGAKVAKPFHEKNGWTNLELFLEPKNRFFKDAAMNGLPTTIIIDKNGQEVARVEGELAWDSAEVETFLKKLM